MKIFLLSNTNMNNISSRTRTLDALLIYLLKSSQLVCEMIAIYSLYTYCLSVETWSSSEIRSNWWSIFFIRNLWCFAIFLCFLKENTAIRDVCVCRQLKGDRNVSDERSRCHVVCEENILRVNACSEFFSFLVLILSLWRRVRIVKTEREGIKKENRKVELKLLRSVRKSRGRKRIDCVWVSLEYDSTSIDDFWKWKWNKSSHTNRFPHLLSSVIKWSISIEFFIFLSSRFLIEIREWWRLKKRSFQVEKRRKKILWDRWEIFK
jgi:hypothetical protein